MTQKQQQLLFDKGITNVPSDVLCSDNTLAESVGMVYDNGEHRVIQRPVETITSWLDAQEQPSSISATLLYIHKYNDKERYIAHKSDGSIIWGIKDGNTFRQKGDLTLSYSDGTSVTSVGKTLIITSEGTDIKHYLWKSTSYEAIGEIPDPEVEFWLVGDNEIETNPQVVSGEGDEGGTLDDDTYPYTVVHELSCDGIVKERGKDSPGLAVIEPQKQEDFNNLTVGLYAANKKSVAQKKGFCLPFFVRYALKLYDGSYTHISNPILMMPTVRRNSYMYYLEGSAYLAMFTKLCKLHCSVKSGYRHFADIVESVDIFISQGVEIYDTTLDQKVYNLTDADQNSRIIFDGIYRTATNANDLLHENADTRTIRHWADVLQPGGDWRTSDYRSVDTLKQKDAKDLSDEITSASVFYKLCSLGTNGFSGDLGEKFNTHTLETLTTQEQLPEDDYFSRSALKPGFAYAYNSRLNLANVSRQVFDGFGYFMPFCNSQTNNIYTIFVTIKTDTGDITVSREVTTRHFQGHWFYYPDSRASHIVIKRRQGNTDVEIIRAKLKQHEGLNGAYYFNGLPTSNADAIHSDGFTGNDSATDTQTEQLPNQIVTSEVNNPYLFKAEGYNKVGTGKIEAISTTTQALSEGQFGGYPLLVFSDSGIWAMAVNNTGLFSSIQPMSREVCNNVKSITQTDGAVFFTSEKGLMVIVGSQVKCVSEQMSGKTDAFAKTQYPGLHLNDFLTYLKSCYIAYDYRDSLLWILSSGALCCYVYAIKSGTFSKFNIATRLGSSGNMKTVVNNYPDYLLQTADGRVFSLLSRQDINSVAEQADDYDAHMLTRPMKLENGLALKSIMQVKNIRDMQGTMTMRIFASNDLTHWYEKQSLRGVPWKYYRFRFDFAGLKATDRFAGSVLITQERRTDKLR